MKSTQARVALVFGTRPEAIKMAPLVLGMKARSGEGIIPKVYVTGQHREMLDQVLEQFQITPDADLNVMQPGQELTELTAKMLTGMGKIFSLDRPDLVLVHGDTSTALAATMAAFYHQIPIGHVEAGLRTWNLDSPFPEEMNRQVIDRLARFHYAPTTLAVSNLEKEGMNPSGIFLTGNTVIDALYLTLDQIGHKGQTRLVTMFPSLKATLEQNRRMILVTSHRRENHQIGLTGICKALIRLAKIYPEMDIVFPVHPNPHVRKVVEENLKGNPKIILIDPVEYDLFSYLISRAFLILTDSGGIQEEAPALNKPVLVLRNTSERPEAVEAGAALVVGTDPDRIVKEASNLIDNPQAYQVMASAKSPYGDGKASDRIIDSIIESLTTRKAA